MLNNRLSFEKDKNDFDHFANEDFYADVFTLNVDKVVGAWDRLGADILPLQIGMYPAVFHHALLKTLETSKNA